MRIAALQHHSVSMSLQLASRINSLEKTSAQELFRYVSVDNNVEAYRTLLQLPSETPLKVR